MAKEELYMTPYGPGIRREGDDRTAAKLEKLWIEDGLRSGLRKANYRLIERVQAIIKAEKDCG